MINDIGYSWHIIMPDLCFVISEKNFINVNCLYAVFFDNYFPYMMRASMTWLYLISFLEGCSYLSYLSSHISQYQKYLYLLVYFLSFIRHKKISQLKFAYETET